MLHVKQIDLDLEQANLAEEWTALQRKSGLQSLFLSPEWFFLCQRYLARGQKPIMLALRDGKTLVGIAPLMRETVWVRGFPLERIGFLQNPLTPFCDFICLDKPSFFQAIASYLMREAEKWDLLRFTKLRADSASISPLVSSFKEHGLSFNQQTVSWTPILPIQNDWHTFYGSKSRKFRMTHRSTVNRLHRLGDLSVEEFTSDREVQSALECLLGVSAAGWKRVQGKDALDPAFESAFLRDLVLVGAARGWVSVWLLRLNDKVLAAEFHIRDGDRVYGLRAQYDQSYATYSPGRYLDYEIVQRLFEKGVACYDMGPGVASYKEAWSDSKYPSFSFEAFHSRPYPSFVGRLHSSWIPALKRTQVGKLFTRA